MKRLTNSANFSNRIKGHKMHNAQRFNFVEGFDTFGVPDALPQLQLFLTYRGSSVEVAALLDTGATAGSEQSLFVESKRLLAAG
jgi:hypothetical protein